MNRNSVRNKPDAFRAVRDDGLDVVLVLDVGGEVDDLAVERDGGLPLDFAQFFLERRLDFARAGRIQTASGRSGLTMTVPL